MVFKKINQRGGKRGKEMTVEELVQVLDKSHNFEVREVYSENRIFSSDDWYGKTSYNHKTFEEVKERIVHQISTFNDDEFTVYVEVAPPVGEDS